MWSALYNMQSDGSYPCTACSPLARNPICTNATLSVRSTQGYDRDKKILRLCSSGVGPPVPRVEDQHVHALPCISALD